MTFALSALFVLLVALLVPRAASAQINVPNSFSPGGTIYSAEVNANLADIAEVWRRGSVITSWLLDLTASALAKDGQLEGFSGSVEDSGEGRWTIEAAIEEAVPADVLAASLFVRFRSRQDHTFAEKVLSAMRLGFGGHVEAPKK